MNALSIIKRDVRPMDGDGFAIGGGSGDITQEGWGLAIDNGGGSGC